MSTSRLAAIAVAVAASTAFGAIVVPGPGSVAAAGIVHVSPTGSDSADGSAGSPVQTIRRAVQLASAGDVVRIGTGTYHEQVQVYSKEVHLTAAPGADVVFDGAIEVSGWQRSGDTWAAAWSTDFARAGTPHTTGDRPEAGWPEQFFFDGAPLVEVASAGAVTSGTFYYDRSSSLVLIGDNPTGHLLEGSDLNWAIYLNHADGSSVSGITARRYATPSTNMAAIRAYADDLLLEDLVVEQNAYMGVSAIGANIEFDGIVSRGNGHLGAHAHRTDGLTVTDSTISDNNVEWFDPFHAAGGIKITESTDIDISDSTVSDNNGPGIWTDLDTTDVTITGNTVQRNGRSGIELELSARIVVANNVVTDNGEAGVWVLESSDADIWHNALFENHRDIWVEDGPRDDVERVDIVNNTMGGVGTGAPAILNVDDWTSDRSAEEMQVTLQGNRYWLPAASATRHISRWADWPYPLKLSTDIAGHRAATGSDADASLSRAAGNPFVRTAADWRQPAGAPDGAMLTSAIAAALDIDRAAFAAGPLGADPGAPAPGTTTTSTTSTSTTTTSTTMPGDGEPDGTTTTTSTTTSTTSTSTTVPRGSGQPPMTTSGLRPAVRIAPRVQSQVP